MSQASSILRLTSNMPDPDNFFRGATAHLPLPRDVLLFRRDKPLHQDPPEVHARFVLVVCLNRQCDVVVDDHLLPLEAGQCTLIHPYQNHHYAKPWEKAPAMLFVSFELEKLESLKPLKQAVISLQVRQWQLLAAMVQSHLATMEGDGAQAEDLPLTLGLLLVSLLRLPQEVAGPGAMVRERSRQYDLIGGAIAYMERHMDQPISNEEVASAMNVSESHLRAVFRTTFGLGLGAYVRRVKMFHASRLLRQTQDSVTQIARQCGFTSLYAFSRCFHREVGLSPMRFRANTQGDPQHLPRRLRAGKAEAS